MKLYSELSNTDKIKLTAIMEKVVEYAHSQDEDLKWSFCEFDAISAIEFCRKPLYARQDMMDLTPAEQHIVFTRWTHALTDSIDAMLYVRQQDYKTAKSKFNLKKEHDHALVMFSKHLQNVGFNWGDF